MGGYHFFKVTGESEAQGKQSSLLGGDSGTVPMEAPGAFRKDYSPVRTACWRWTAI